MDMEKAGVEIAKALSTQYKGVDVLYGTVLGRRDDGSVTVQVGGGVVAAKAMASFDVGASVGCTVMIVDVGGVLTIMGAMANSTNSNEFTNAITQINEANANIEQIEGNIQQVGQDLSEVKDQAQAASDAADAAQSAANDAQQAATEAGQAADQAQESITSLTTTVNGVQTDLESLTSTVSGVSETANSALSAASSAQQDIDGFKTTVSQTYETKSDADAAMAQEVLDRNSAISQSASSILSQVEQNYINNTTGATFATKTEVQQTADSITQSVSENYQVKGDYLTTTDASETYATQSQLTQTADSITSSVSDTYLTKADASSTYATGDQLTEAIADEVTNRNSAISQSASQVLTEVSQNYVNNATGATYATKTELSQTESSITSTVAETYLTKTDATQTYATQTQLTQTSDSLNISIQQAATAASNAQSTANSASSSAATANQAAITAQDAANMAQSTADGAMTQLDTVNTYFDFDTDGLHVGKRATTSTGETYETAETLMGSDGTFGIYDSDGNEIARVAANGFIFASGRFGLGHNPNSPSVLQLYSLQAGDTVKVYTDNDGVAMLYCNDNQPQYHGCAYVQRQYAALSAGNGTSDSLGSGGLIGVQMSGGTSYASIRAQRLYLTDLDTNANTTVDMAQVASRLGGDASHQSIAGGVTLMTHPCGSVCLAVNAANFPALSQWGTQSLGTVPEAYRPPVQVGTMGYFATNSGQVLGTVVVGVNGAVVFTAYQACDAGSITCNLSWCV